LQVERRTWIFHGMLFPPPVEPSHSTLPPRPWPGLFLCREDLRVTAMCACVHQCGTRIQNTDTANVQRLYAVSMRFLKQKCLKKLMDTAYKPLKTPLSLLTQRDAFNPV
jgi:hypothetical protein